MMVWTWVVDRLARPRSRRLSPGASTTPPDLRAHLPVLWPHGPNGAVDEVALSTLGRGYARAGRSLQDLLADLDVLCSVVGIGTSSRMVEASSIAWSDAFLDGVASGSGAADGTHRSTSAGSTDAEDLDEVERLLAGARAGAAWGDLVPTARILQVTWSVGRPSPEELARVVAETRRLFPRSAVAAQPDLCRVVAAVADSPSLPGRVATLGARSAELVAGVPPTVSVSAAPADSTTVGRLLRRAG